MSNLLLGSFVGGRSLPAALHLPRSRLSAGGDGGAGSGGPQGCLPGALCFSFHRRTLCFALKFQEHMDTANKDGTFVAGVNPLAGRREGASGDDRGSRL